MKVLHLPTSVGGNSWGLAQGERTLGLDSRVLYVNSNQLNYPSDINLKLDQIHSSLSQKIILLRTFLDIRNKYDVYNFNFGSSLIDFPRFNLYRVDLPFYSKKAKLFATYNGCDARQKYPTLRRKTVSACHDPGCYQGICNSGALDAFKQQVISHMAKYVRHIWALNPDLLYFLPPQKSSFLPYSVSLSNFELARPDVTKRALNIVHAPTNPEAKGTRHILAALEVLRKKHGVNFNFQLVQNVSHEQALNIYKKADLIIDQVLIGWYGAVAIEVMTMGKPVICRIAREDLHFLPAAMAGEVLQAFILAEPENLVEKIGKALEDREYLREKSEAALEYAMKWHIPSYVASLTKERYES
jgi:hypothetical protein